MYYFKLEELKTISESKIEEIGKERYLFLKVKRADIILLLYDAGELLADIPLYISDIPQIENKKTAYLGFIHPKTPEITQSDKKMILNLAEIYLRKLKVEKIVTPLDRDTWSEYRIKTKSILNKSFYGEPKNTDAWLYDHNKYNKKYNYISTLNDLNFRKEKNIDDINFRYITKDTIDKDIEEIYTLSTEEFKNNLFYGDIQKEIFISQYLDLFNKLKPDILVAEKDNQIIGFLLGFYAENYIVGKKTYVMKTIAVKSNFRGLGIGNELYKRLGNRVFTAGCTKIIGALIYQDNCSYKIATKYENTEILSEYALYEKDLRKD